MSDARDRLSAAIASKKPPQGPRRPHQRQRPLRPLPLPPRLYGLPNPRPKSPRPKSPRRRRLRTKTSGGNVLGNAFGKLAKNFVDELKDATSEISPKQLIETAKGGIQNLRSARDAGGVAEAASPSDPVAASGGAQSSNAPAGEALPSIETSSGDTAPSPEAPAQNGGDEKPANWSAAKVQRAPKKRAKKTVSAEAAESTAAPTQEAATAPSAEASPGDQPAEAAPVDGATSEATTPDETAAAESPAAAAGEVGPDFQEEPIAVSPAKVKRSTKRNPTKEDIVEAAPEEPAVEVVEAVDEPLSEAPIAGEELRPDEPESAVAPASEGTAETAPAEAGEPGEAAAPTASKKEASQTNGKRPAKKLATRAPQADVSPEEQRIRGFHALHTLLNNEIWRPIVVDNDAKPSSIFAPRQHFDKQWATPEFKEGLKAASKLATTYTFDPENIAFDVRIIDAISGFKLDPTKAIKPHTELIGKAIDTKTAETVLKMMKRSDVSKLLHSAGTRLATFVPTIELLARIYLGLRKKEDIIPGDRLTI